MSEEAILHLIYHAIGIVLGMVCGWLLHSNRDIRLAEDNGLYTDDGSRTAKAAERTQDLIDATESISDIIKKYENSIAEDQNSE